MANPDSAARQQDLNTPNSKTAVEVSMNDLPAHCTAADPSLWNSHPRVYIPLKEKGGEAKCPYCGTLYKILAS